MTGSVELHTTAEVTSRVLESAYVAVATNRRVAPTGIEAVWGEMDIPVATGTSNWTPLLDPPATITTTFPVAAPAGTAVVIDVALQLAGVAATPLKRSVLLPFVAPKFAPVITTVVPTIPDVGDTLDMIGEATTVKLRPLPLTPFARTTTLPVVAPLGTGTRIIVSLQVVGVPNVPLNRTEPSPCAVPKFVPFTVIRAPAAPEFGDKLLIFAFGTTEKLTPLLSTPAARTTTAPVVAPEGTVATTVVADQLVVLAVTPLNLTVLLPLVAPKFAPEMVTDAPTAPEVRESRLIVGAGNTVKVRPLLALPATVTMTLPVVALVGTVATMVVLLQLAIAAVVPLNLTVLPP